MTVFFLPINNNDASKTNFHVVHQSNQNNVFFRAAVNIESESGVSGIDIM